MRANAALLTLAALAASCSFFRKPTEPGIDTDGPAYTLRIWIDADPRLPRAAILEGCATWRVERVTCVEVKDPALAKVRVYADDSDCSIKDDPDHVSLAWAYWGGSIRMMMRCMPHKGAVYDPHEFHGVVAHEVGHQLGIWDHVPSSCDDKDVKIHAKDGRKICGRAVMNPYYDPDVIAPTAVDMMAFDERDVDHSVLMGDLPRKDTPDCVYEAPAHH